MVYAPPALRERVQERFVIPIRYHWVNFTATQRTVALCIGRFVLTPIMVLRNSLTCSIMFRDVLLNMVLEPEGGDYLRQLAVSVLI